MSVVAVRMSGLIDAAISQTTIQQPLGIGARNVRLKSWLRGKGEVMKRILLASIATCCCLLTVQSATAKGCLEGAALGGAVGHMRHHTFLGIFGGCAGGLYVHHLYT
ncbi:MAG: hypothetical protein WCB44_20670, partial [Stellaceae bacterium]